MSSPTGSDNNSFEDAENGNTSNNSGALVIVEAVTGVDMGLAAPENVGIENPLSENDTVTKELQPDPTKLLVDFLSPEPNQGEVGQAPPPGDTGNQDKVAPVMDQRDKEMQDAVPPIASPTSANVRAQAGPTLDKPSDSGQSSTSPSKGSAVQPVRSVGFSQKGAQQIMAVGVLHATEDDTSLMTRDGAEGEEEDADNDGDESTLCGLHPNCCRPRCCFARCTWLSWTFCSLASLVTLVAFTCAAYFLVAPAVREQIRKALILRPQLKEFETPPGSKLANIYFFDIENPESFINGIAIPRLRQMGPYVYRIDARKVNISWNDNSTVTYRELYSLHFDPSKSNGSEVDEIRTANIPLIAVKSQLGAVASVLEAVISKEASRMVETHTVKELLWGYESPALKEMKTDAKWIPFGSHVLDFPTTFSLCAELNDTAGPVFNVYTGADNFSRVNDVYTWDYQRKLHYWLTDQANTIQGTDGGSFKPFLNDNSLLTIFYSQLYRAFELEFQESRSYHGLDALRFIIPDTQFSNHSSFGYKRKSDATSRDNVRTSFTPAAMTNATDRPAVDDDLPATSPDVDLDESGYCVPHCVPSGVYSVEPCTDAPVYISLPHFLGADPVYLSGVSGLSPQEDKHRPIWDIDQVTGITVSNRRRHQVNVKLQPRQQGETFLPIMWLDVEVDIEDGFLSRIKQATKVTLFLNILILLCICLIATLLTVSIGFVIFNVAREGRVYQRLTDQP